MKYLSIIKYILLILSVIFTIYGVVSEAGLDTMLWFAYALIGLAILSSVCMPLVGIVQNPKSAAKSLVGVALVAVVFLASWALSDTTPIKVASGAMLDNPGELRFADMGLWSTYIMFAALLCTMVVTEIYKAFK